MNDINKEIVTLLPKLKGYSVSLCRNKERAEDLVHDTIVAALENIHQFQVGTNLIAWLVTIMRNTHYSKSRHRWREIQDFDGAQLDSVAVLPNQLDNLVLKETLNKLEELPKIYKDALYLISVMGLSYAEASRVLKVHPTTLKTRVFYARRNPSSNPRPVSYTIKPQQLPNAETDPVFLAVVA